MSQELQQVNNQLPDKRTVDDEISELTANILDETDPKKAKELMDLFEWNMSKKQIVRMAGYDQLLDTIQKQIGQRLDKRPDCFSNKDLIDYMNTIQTAMDKSKQSVANSQENPPSITYTNTQVNVNILDNYDKESKDRVMAAVKAILEKGKTQVPPEELKTIEVDAEEINNYKDNQETNQTNE